MKFSCQQSIFTKLAFNRLWLSFILTFWSCFSMPQLCSPTSSCVISLYKAMFSLVNGWVRLLHFIPFLRAYQDLGEVSMLQNEILYHELLSLSFPLVLSSGSCFDHPYYEFVIWWYLYMYIFSSVSLHILQEFTSSAWNYNVIYFIYYFQIWLYSRL